MSPPGTQGQPVLDASAAALVMLVAALVNVLGMAWLALSLDFHWEQVQGQMQDPELVIRLRVCGVLSLACGLALCHWTDHPSMAVLVWVMTLTAAALLVALILTWRPRCLRVLAWLVRGRSGS
ncbi:DUF3325 domain-containing protein [Ottowia thiooxydans]|uniref:DUF3325 domain-containing protein n=1 Tax=Ottowia thiooxydans TaxID=219182 RepID=A0ABV2Q3A7_9BURK